MKHPSRKKDIGAVTARPGVRDLIDESLAGVTSRPGRSFLTTVGTAVGVGMLVATIGLSSTTRAQISNRFNALSATEVDVQDSNPGTANMPPFPRDLGAALRPLTGVTAAGRIWNVDTATAPIEVAPTPRLPDAAAAPPVMAASPGAFAVMHPRGVDGHLFDELEAGRGERVAVLGQAAASTLGLTSTGESQAIFIGGVGFTVVGIVKDVDRRPEMLLSVVIPDVTAENLWGAPRAAQAIIETRLGAAGVVGAQVALALRPDDPQRLNVITPPDPTAIRMQVNGDASNLVLLLGVVSLVIGAIGIANITFVSVLERIFEIGLRRALGASRTQIACQFLLESTTLGTFGGLLGSSLGVVAVVVIAGTLHYSPVMTWAPVLGAPLLGTLTGLLAGIYPALRAAGLDPTEALRR